MIEMMDCDEARITIGAYVLGSIDPIERALVDAHLVDCQECREELTGLAGLPALLSRVDAEVAAGLADDVPAGREGEREEVLGNVIDLASARSRRRRWRTAGLSAVAAVAIGVAGFGGAETLASHGGGPPSVAEGLNYGSAASDWTTVHGAADGMLATVAYRQMGWGTQMAAKVTGIPLGTPCRLIEVGPDGTRTVVGGWTTDKAEGTVWYPASAGTSADQVRGFQITVTGRPTIALPA